MSMAMHSPPSHDGDRPASDYLPLFCLPHAGGTAAHFTTWHRWLPDGVLAVPVDLPGHGTRPREPLIEEWSPLVASLTRTVAARIDGPYALAGHSLGALLAFDVARALDATGQPPELLLVAGRNGPSAGPSHRPIHDLPDAQLVEALRRLGGTPDAVLRESSLMELFLPTTRADLRLAETYARPPGPALPTPVVAVVGRRDKMADPPGALAWQRETTGTFDLTVLDAGHFLLDHPEFIRAAGAALGRLRSRPDRR